MHRIETHLVGEESEVRAHLDGLLDVLGDFVRFLNGTAGGAALKVGSKGDVFTEERWTDACKRLKRGTTREVSFERNTFYPDMLYSFVYVMGTTRVTCELRIGDKHLGTGLRVQYRLDVDEAVTPRQFRDWVRRIADASAMTPAPRYELFWEDTEEPVQSDVESPLGRAFQAALDSIAAGEASPPVDELPNELAGIPISGWDRLQEEMELSIVADQPLGASHRRAVVAVARAWVEDGSATGFGGGSFHGWMPGEWDGEVDYHFDVDSGSQDVDWQVALADLAGRLVTASASLGIPLAIRLGPPMD